MDNRSNTPADSVNRSPGAAASPADGPSMFLHVEDATLDKRVRADSRNPATFVGPMASKFGEYRPGASALGRFLCKLPPRPVPC